MSVTWLLDECYIPLISLIRLIDPLFDFKCKDENKKETDNKTVFSNIVLII